MSHQIPLETQHLLAGIRMFFLHILATWKEVTCYWDYESSCDCFFFPFSCNGTDLTPFSFKVLLPVTTGFGKGVRSKLIIKSSGILCQLWNWRILRWKSNFVSAKLLVLQKFWWWLQYVESSYVQGCPYNIKPFSPNHSIRINDQHCSSNINEVIRAVLNLLFFLHAPKSPKAQKAQRRK